MERQEEKSYFAHISPSEASTTLKNRSPESQAFSLPCDVLKHKKKGKKGKKGKMKKI